MPVCRLPPRPCCYSRPCYWRSPSAHRRLGIQCLSSRKTSVLRRRIRRPRSALPRARHPSRCHRHPVVTRRLCHRKDDRAMRTIGLYVCLSMSLHRVRLQPCSTGSSFHTQHANFSHPTFNLPKIFPGFPGSRRVAFGQRRASEGVGLIVSAISFQDFQPI